MVDYCTRWIKNTGFQYPEYFVESHMAATMGDSRKVPAYPYVIIKSCKIHHL